MAEKKKPSPAKKTPATQRFSDVAKELDVEVKVLLGWVSEFVEQNPQWKDFIYSEGKKPSASSTCGKTYKADLMAFIAPRLPEKAKPEPEPVKPVEAPAKPSVVTPTPSVRPPLPVQPRAIPPTQAPRPAAHSVPTPQRGDLPPMTVKPPVAPSRPSAPLPPPVIRSTGAPVVSRPQGNGNEAATPGSKGTVTVRPPIVVRDFAISLNMKPFQVVSDLMALGKVVAVNTVIDEADAQLVAERHGFKLEIRHRGEGVQPIKKVEVKPNEDDPALQEARPPVVCVLGHVDHGKTTLLDFFRKANVAAGEAGGITQRIGAYSVTYAGENPEYKGRTVTFLDTPGHAAFAKMRERGASVTDVAVLVVAADDGFMPQTDEALKFAQKHARAIVTAINKTDAKGANVDRVKQQMQQRGITPEDWGGETIAVPVSALKGDGMDNLIESILLQSDVLELKTNPKCPAQGVIIESQKETGRGPTATIIVQKGTLKPGDAFVCGETWCKVRALMDERGQRLQSVGPGCPALVLGWEDVPAPGANFRCVKNDREARDIAEEAALAARKASEDAIARAPAVSVGKPGMSDLEKLMAALATDKDKVLRVLLKADVNGTLEALRGCLEAIPNDKVTLEIVGGSVGAITQGDVALAEASKATIIAFDAKADTGVQPMLKRAGIRVISHDIIYMLIELVKEAMTELLDPILRENKLGSAEVRAVFDLSKAMVAGCMVSEGLLRRSAKARLIRKGQVIHTGTLETLKRFKDDASEVKAGFECGARISGYDTYAVGDVLECFEVLEVRPTL
ncbi:MAG TPA: translation initiation factor IF-2 [Opitutae bacterium]|nr:translation initiation factor IF-2 [Opitutae bacterium]